MLPPCLTDGEAQVHRNKWPLLSHTGVRINYLSVYVCCVWWGIYTCLFAGILMWRPEEDFENLALSLSALVS